MVRCDSIVGRKLMMTREQVQEQCAAWVVGLAEKYEGRVSVNGARVLCNMLVDAVTWGQMDCERDRVLNKKKEA